eukprot:Mrub_07198.p2 GENE.Mrub_07198~~Mrub_07198.p2  ORF type:complete len:170 (-),score=26.72 Mrub_07198:330-839(-)
MLLGSLCLAAVLLHLSSSMQQLCWSLTRLTVVLKQASTKADSCSLGRCGGCRSGCRWRRPSCWISCRIAYSAYDDVNYSEVGLELVCWSRGARSPQLVGDALQLEQERLAILEGRLAHALVVELDLEPGLVQFQLNEDQLLTELGFQRIFLDPGYFEAVVRDLPGSVSP